MQIFDGDGAGCSDTVVWRELIRLGLKCLNQWENMYNDLCI